MSILEDPEGVPRALEQFNGEFRLFIGPNSDERLAIEITTRSKHLWFSLRCLLCRTDFFISYRMTEANDYARNLALALEQLGYRIYVAAREDLPAGREASETFSSSRLGKHLRRRLKDSRMLVLIESRTMHSSDWVGWEAEAFDDEHGLMWCPTIDDFPYTQVGKFPANSNARHL